MLNGAIAVHYDAAPEELPIMSDITTTRLFTKLDDISSSISTTQADVARVQGGQKAMESHLDTIRVAIGDVTETKLEVRETKVKMEGVERDVLDIKKTLADASARNEMKSWVEPLVRWAVSALLGGSAIGAGAVAAQKVFGG